MDQFIAPIAAEMQVEQKQVANTLKLLEEGNTVPFIARYRKEMTSGLDEEQILHIQQQYQYQVNLASRKETVLHQIEVQGKLTDEIRQAIAAAEKLSQVEDLYRPYVQKKKTRAGLAIAAGLQPLADWMMTNPAEGSLKEKAAEFINEKITSTDQAIQGGCDIIAETVSDNAKLRWRFKDVIVKTAVLVTKVKKNNPDEAKTYQMYYDRREKLTSLVSHRIMAIDRAEKEKVITVTFEYDSAGLMTEAVLMLTHGRPSVVEEQLKQAAADGCERLLFPSVEREIRSDQTESAQQQSIEVFSANLEKLLLQPPLKGRIVMGFDPAFRTGCKLAVLDQTGKMLHIDKIFPHAPVSKKEEAAAKTLKLIREYNVAIIAIGNGTASRESEQFVAELIKENKLDVSYAIVSEAGASVYSASAAARAEFPDLHVEERSAVSIGRRLLDPLSELIKIDPQSIGVGQYQHDLPAKQLDQRLDEAIMKCVNRVGCDLNTASVELLTHISGLTKTSAQAIVEYRNANGRFDERSQLLNVKKMGEKTFTQCAGFLRIKDGTQPLDETSIHPESYKAATALMKQNHITVLGQSDIVFDQTAAAELGLDDYTLKDIEEAIRQPLRDYRDQFTGALLRSDVLTIDDLKVGQKLSGTVRNVVDFGAFVDIGLHQDGLVHVSRMSKSHLTSPYGTVAVGDIVTVWVAAIDKEKERVSLQMIPYGQTGQ